MLIIEVEWTRAHVGKKMHEVDSMEKSGDYIILGY